jgi:hypothetical protein
LEVLRTAILDFCRTSPSSSFCPTEVLKRMYPEDWSMFLPEIRETMMEMFREGLILVFQNDIPINSEEIPQGPVRIKARVKPN